MEKLTAEIIKEQLVGESSGHMANIPNNPLFYSMFRVYLLQNGSDIYNYQHSNENLFAKFLREIADALEDIKKGLI